MLPLSNDLKMRFVLLSGDFTVLLQPSNELVLLSTASIGSFQWPSLTDVQARALAISKKMEPS